MIEGLIGLFVSVLTIVGAITVVLGGLIFFKAFMFWWKNLR